ncbi:MAG: type II toxin-antitoxin system VapC family toxin [Alphaproteobacteria bacterium]|nr:type II toxin-antitoxin system VapC family toxin [Alphaproteobacteria bacterium]USO07484.1 MAG: type II toxin-antitoxin system VapC family toxin [Rhodospirillales bacterium]
MNYLLDTHILLSALYDDAQLSSDVRAALTSPDHRFFVSHASLWEISLQQQQGRLDYDPDFYALLERTNLNQLPIDLRHIAGTAALPPMHKDPFDRMLVAQAAAEGMVIVTDDVRLSLYDVPLLRN